jgi:hypothetical protein
VADNNSRFLATRAVLGEFVLFAMLFTCGTGWL